MLLSEIIITKMQYYPHLFDLSDENFKDKHEKVRDFNIIASEINEEFNIGSDPKEELTGAYLTKKNNFLASYKWGHGPSFAFQKKLQ